MKLMNAFFVSTVLAGEFQRFDRWTCNKLCSLDMNHCFCIAKSGSRIFKMKFELRAMLHRRIFSPIQNQCHSSCSQCRCQRLAAQLKSHIRQDFAIEVTGSVSKWWLWALAFVATRIMLVSKVGQLEILGLLNGRSCNGMEAKSSGERCSYRVIYSDLPLEIVKQALHLHTLLVWKGYHHFLRFTIHATRIDFLNSSIAQAFFFGRCLHIWLTWVHGGGRRIFISAIVFWVQSFWTFEPCTWCWWLRRLCRMSLGPNAEGEALSYQDEDAGILHCKYALFVIVCFLKQSQ